MAETVTEKAPGIAQHPVPGIEVQLGWYTYTIPPLLLEHVRRAFTEGLMDKIAKVEQAGGVMTAGSLDALDAIQQLTLWSIKRNYPEMTLEKVSEILDVGNQWEVQSAIFKLNRFTTRPTQAVAEQAPAPTPAPTNSGATLNVH